MTRLIPYTGKTLGENETVRKAVYGKTDQVLEPVVAHKHSKIEKDYIAQTTGTRNFPWRAFVIAENDARLVESELIYKLGAPDNLENTGWIKPGQVAWDWWNDAITREGEIDLSFLPAGEFVMEIFQDGINAAKHAQDYKHLKRNVKQGIKIKINLAPGGGWVAKISPLK